MSAEKPILTYRPNLMGFGLSMPRPGNVLGRGDLYTTEPYKGIDTMLLKAVTIAALVCAEQDAQAKPSKWVPSERQRSVLREMLRHAEAGD